MANKAAKSGTAEIRNARKLFEGSENTDDARFRYAALAIGKNPLTPPKWAIEACIKERRRTERIAATRAGEEDGKILDEMAVLLIEHELAQPTSKSQHPSLASILREAAKRVDRDKQKPNGDALRTARRAWDKEQQQFGDDAVLVAGQKSTPRIERIKARFFGVEYGTSSDPAVDTYWRYRKEVMRDPLVGNIDMD